jgi:hypothetical protein
MNPQWHGTMAGSIHACHAGTPQARPPGGGGVFTMFNSSSSSDDANSGDESRSRGGQARGRTGQGNARARTRSSGPDPVASLLFRGALSRLYLLALLLGWACCMYLVLSSVSRLLLWLGGGASSGGGGRTVPARGANALGGPAGAAAQDRSAAVVRDARAAATSTLSGRAAEGDTDGGGWGSAAVAAEMHIPRDMAIAAWRTGPRPQDAGEGQSGADLGLRQRGTPSAGLEEAGRVRGDATVSQQEVAEGASGRWGSGTVAEVEVGQGGQLDAATAAHLELLKVLCGWMGCMEGN